MEQPDDNNDFSVEFEADGEGTFIIKLSNFNDNELYYCEMELLSTIKHVKDTIELNEQLEEVDAYEQPAPPTFGENNRRHDK